MFERSSITIGKNTFEVMRSETEILVDGNHHDIPTVILTDRMVTVRLSDRVEQFVVNRNGDDLWLEYHGRKFPLVIETDRDRLLKVASQAATHQGGASVIKAAMPGLVVRINVAVGQFVKRGESVLILEAMKMENDVCANADGIVLEIKVNERESVEKGAQLITIGE